MIEEKERTVIQKYRIWHCDYPGCDYKIENNKGCCGHAPVMQCHFCEKDICTKHTTLEYDSGDYPILCTCISEECLLKKEAWLEEYFKEDEESD